MNSLRVGRWLLPLLVLSIGLVHGAPPPLADASGDPLPVGALARFGTLRFRNGAPLQSVRYLADGKTIASLSIDGTLRWWDAKTGKETMTHEGGVVSPDGRTIAVVQGTGALCLTDAATRKEIHIGAKDASINNFVFSPDGKTVAVMLFDNNGLFGQVRTYDVATGKELHDFLAGEAKEGQQGFMPNAIAFAGNIVAAIGQENGQGGIIHLWEGSTGKLLPDLGDSSVNNLLNFSPDGKLLLHIVTDPEKGTNKLRLSEPGTGRMLHDLSDQANVNQSVFSPNGRFLLLVDGAQAARIFNTTTGKELPAPNLDPANGQPLSAAVFSPDGSVLALATMDGRVRLLATATGKVQHTLAGFAANGAQMNTNLFNNQPLWTPLSFSPDGKQLVGAGVGGVVRIWDTATGKEVKGAGAGHDGAVAAVAFSADGRWLATTGEDGAVILWDRAAHTQKHRFAGPPLAAGAAPAAAVVAFSADGKRLAAGWVNGSVQVWDIETAKEVLKIQAHQGPVAALLFAPGGRTLITAGQDNKAVAWSTATGKQTGQFAAGNAAAPNALFGMTLSPNGRTLAIFEVGNDGHNHLKFYETASGKVRHELKVKQGAIGGNGEVFWQAGLGGAAFAAAVPVQIEDPQGGPMVPAANLGYSLTFTPDGRRVAWSSGNNIELWDAERGQEVRRFGLSEGAVAGFAFSPDGKTLAAAAADGTVRVWDVATGTVVARATGHRGPATCLAFAPDGRSIVSGGADTTALLWDVPAVLAADPVKSAPPAAAEVANLWKLLEGDDAVKAHEALVQLAHSGAAVIPLAREQVHPVQAPAADRLARLLRDLESPEFEARSLAAEELEALGELAAPAIRKRLADEPPLDLRQRLAELLDKANGPVTHADHIRGLRVVELLERVASPEARALLSQLAKGAADAGLTREATAALRRLEGGR